MTVDADSWTITITQEELESLIREKTQDEFPDCFINKVSYENDLITISMVRDVCRTL
jgi:hypothetical protein